ncbi:MAG: ArnT family glycosyltransferase [Bacteroidaceae bacterium]
MRKNNEKILLYMGLCLAVLPVIFLRDFTPANELRYLSLAEEALREHRWWAFTNHGDIFADKPPLYLWIVMLGKMLFGSHQMWFLALFSMVPAVMTVRIMDHWVSSELDTDSRSLACMMLTTAGLFLGLAVTLRMDLLMCLFVVLAMRAFWRMKYVPQLRRREQWLFPVYTFLAVFTNGFVGIIVPLCSTVVYLWMKGRLRTLAYFWGLRTWGVLAGLTAVWLGMTYMEGGTAYIHHMIADQTLGAILHADIHDRPFYFYLATIWYSFAPYSIFVAAILFTVLRPDFVRTELQRYFLCITLTTFVAISCISSKLQVYMLPAFPFMVYAAAMALPRVRMNAWYRATISLPALAFALALPALVVMVVCDVYPLLNDTLCYITATGISVSGICALRLVYRHRDYTGLTDAVRVLGVGLLFAVFVGGWAMPRLNPGLGYGALCAKVSELSGKTGITDFRAYDLRRPSHMDVYLHTTVNRIDDEKELSRLLYGENPVIVMLPKQALKHFPGHNAHVVGPYAIVVVK